jgi:hypothetical protein
MLFMILSGYISFKNSTDYHASLFIDDRGTMQTGMYGNCAQYATGPAQNLEVCFSFWRALPTREYCF